MTHLGIRKAASAAVHRFCGKLVDNAVRTPLWPV
jgi:hypothetical protein